MEGHIHVESSLLAPAELAKAMVPHGTGALVGDPHEIANVLGLAGVRAMLEAGRDLPLDFFFMAPSCVPATPLEDSGAVLDAGDLEELARHERILGLAEMMNFPGALGGDPGVLAKLKAFWGRPIDGHAPCSPAGSSTPTSPPDPTATTRPWSAKRGRKSWPGACG